MYTRNNFKSSNRGWLTGALAFVMALLVTVAVDAQKPWALRDHYAIKNGATTFSYDVATSEWQVKVANLGPVLDNVTSEIVFENGTSMRIGELKMVRDEREDADGVLGPGTHFRTVYERANGLSVRYSIRRFKTRPFVLLFMEVRNDSTEPQRIASIRPGVFDAASVTNAARNAIKTVHDAPVRGGMPMPTSETGMATYIGFEFNDSNASIGFGVLPGGSTDTRIAIDSSNEGIPQWAGARFDPAITLAPGDSVRVDPIWIGFMDNGRNTLESFYAWSRSVMPTTRRVTKLPSAWVTPDEGQTAEQVYEFARTWRRDGIANVLIPATWEVLPGSQEPRTGLYPSDMSLVATTLQGIGVTAGIACDPLGAAGARDRHVITTAGGQRWFLPNSQESFGAAVLHVQPLIAWGFEFFVVEPSSISDETLALAGMTRLEADMAAMRIMLEAAGNFPVLPSPTTELAGEMNRWQQIAATSRSLPEHSLVAGPVRLLSTQLRTVPEELRVVLRDLAGPLEIVGTPDKQMRLKIANAVSTPAWHARLPRPESAQTDRQFRTR